MTLPASGSSISMSQINTELGRSSTATISLDTAENGGYGTINTCASPYPLSANAASMSEWFSYNHNAPCGNSAYAMTDGGAANTQGMLYSNTKSYSSTVGKTIPSPRDVFTISFWMKRASGESSQGYLFGLAGGTTTDHLYVYWFSLEDPNNPGVYVNKIGLSYNDAGGGYVESSVNISDDNNQSITGVTADFWDNNNQGNVDAHKYSLITVVVDYANWSTDNYVTWYWNSNRLTVPWLNGAFAQSYTIGDTVTTPDWTNSVLYVGGSVPSELSAGCQLDSYAIYLATALTSGNVSTLYNGGEVASLSDYQSISNDLLYYNFESASPSIGEETGNTYDMFLDETGSVAHIADPAV